MKTRLSKLLTIKSFVTITLTIIFSFLAVNGKIPTRDYITIYTVIIHFISVRNPKRMFHVKQR